VPMFEIGAQIIWLFLLALPVACITWTVTHEEVFREPREFFIRRSKTGATRFERKFFYLFTCEYCFSHWVTLFFLVLTDFRMLLDDWRGLIISFFSVVWVANFYMSFFGRIRLEIKKERAEIAAEEKVSKPKIETPPAA